MRYNRFITGLLDFVKKEPIYLWLVIFILFINMLTLFVTENDISSPKDKEHQKQDIALTSPLQKSDDSLEYTISYKKGVTDKVVIVGMAFLFILFFGLILDFLILIYRRRLYGLLVRTPDVQYYIGWSIWDALKIMILFIFLGYLIAIIEAIVPLPIFPAMKNNENFVSMLNSLILDLFTVSIVFYFVIFRYKNRLRDIGLSLRNFFRNIYYGLLGYISVIPILVITLFLTAIFFNLIKYKPAPQPVLEIFLEEKDRLLLVYFAFFVSVIGPIAEEIFFRGFLYNAIKKEAGVKPAIFISAIVFSFLHAHIVGFIPIFILGVLLAFLYEKTKNLVPSITVHIMHNLVMVSFVFLIKKIGP